MTESNQQGRTIFLTGPPLSGKTTTAQLWAMQRARATFAADWDDIQTTVMDSDLVRGRRLPDVTTRYRFAARVAAAQARRITTAGIDCVVTGARVPESPTDPPEWAHTWDDLDRLDPITVVLLPSVEARLARARNDSRRRGPYALSEEQIRESGSWAWNSWREYPRTAVLDTSDMDQQQVIAEIERAVSRLSNSC
jgi:hypothetical protein